MGSGDVIRVSYQNHRLLVGEDGMALGGQEFVVRDTQELHLASLRGCAAWGNVGVSVLPVCLGLRDLLVKVDLGETGEWAGGCTVVARSHLPPGIYVDPYELASLQQHNLTKVTTQRVRPLAASQVRAFRCSASS